MKDRTERTHPSFVVVSFHRTECSGSGVPFFGSNIRCNSYITLKISEAKEYRTLSENRYIDEKRILELRLSPNQFAELLTSMNVGVGIPGTLEYRDGVRIEEPPYEAELPKFKQEIVDSEAETRVLLQELKTTVGNFKLTKADKAVLESVITRLENTVFGHIPFVVKQAYEAIDKTVTEAKGVIDSFYTGLIHRLGVKSLQEKCSVQLLEERE